MMRMRSYSPLRYPGGKNQFYDTVRSLINLNQLCGCTYVEPFAGGSGVALRLIFEDIVEKVIINDYDISIYSFWYSVLHFPEWFCEKIEKTSITMSEYYIQRDIQNNKDNANLRELGFSTFFLNRTNRSGIIKGGPIGGFDQSGTYPLDCRFNKADLINKIRLISSQKERIQLYNLDAIELLRTINWEENKKYFLFLDPPYYKKGNKLYFNYYKYDDHVNLAKLVKTELANKQWIITYDVCDEIKNIYQEIPCRKISLNYSVQTKKTASEYIFYNEIRMPDSI